MVTLAEELPFAAVVSDDHVGMICSSCFASTKDLPKSRCGRCQVVHYCSKDCQKKDWIDHKNECSFLKNCDGVPSSMFRLVARIVQKLKRADAHEPVFNCRVFEDLMDHLHDIKEDSVRMEDFATVLQEFFNHMGKQSVPDPLFLMTIFLKAVLNCFYIIDGSDAIGQGLYLGLSVHDHSCIPDAHVLFDGCKAILVSPDREKKYSKDLSVAYIDLLRSSEDRNAQLQVSYYFTCTCPLCSDPTFDYLYTSARSSCCPDSYCPLDPSAKKLTCYKCGSISGITVNEAIAANYEVTVFWAKAETDALSFDTWYKPYYLNSLIENYEKFSKILSPLNVNLFRLNETIVKFGNCERSNKYAERLLPVCRRHLPVGDPTLTEKLMFIASVMSSENPPTRRIQELIEETFASSVASHGEGHRQTAAIHQMLSTYRIRLQQDEMIIISTEQPYAAVVYEENMGVTCSSCFASTKDIPKPRCGRCRVIRYCSKDCQIKDWIAHHKDECSILKNSTGGIPGAMFRILARIFNKLDRDDGYDEAFNGRDYNDLIGCCDLIKNDPKRKGVFDAVVQEFKKHMSETFAIDPIFSSYLMVMYGKVIRNRLYICKENKDIGLGLYLGLSVHDYSTNPDAHLMFYGCNAILVSPDGEKEYSKNMSVVRR